MRLVLGCGDEQREGWVHLDRWRHGPHVDVVHDLNVAPWPFEDDSAREIRARDVLEHLDDTVGFFDECWRILRAGGRLTVQTVHYLSENCWRDPTHKRGFHPDVFCYFDPDSHWYQMFGRFYTGRTWRVIEVGSEDGNILAVLEPRKGNGDLAIPLEQGESVRVGEYGEWGFCNPLGV